MQHLYQTHIDFNLSFQFQVGPGRHIMLKLGFITNVPRWSTFSDKIEKVTFNLRLRVRYRITEVFLFSVYLVTEMEILSWELSKKKFLISYNKAILSL